MASNAPANFLLSAGQFVKTDGRLCMITEVKNVLGYNEYHLVDFDTGSPLKRARYKLDPTEFNLYDKEEEILKEKPTTQELPEVKESRFKQHDEAQLNEFALNRNSKRTKQQTTWAVSIFKGK